MRWLAVVAICLAVCAHARADDWGVKRDPFDAGVVKRYQAILVRDPHDVGALRQLVAMYRKHRTVDKLEAEYRAALGGADDWATLVVLARLPRTSRTDTIELWNRAIKLRPDDARGWLAIGELAIDAKTAVDAFRRAAEHAATKRDKRTALDKLVRAAKSANDANTIDAAYAELVTLAPKDGLLWLERGEAQLAAKRFAEASASFVTAQSLLGTDPERRLTAMLQQGVALEQLGRSDEAIAQYQRALDKTPRGYYLAADIVARIVDVHRKRGKLADAIALLEKRWPERARGHLEWVTLGDLYKETGDEQRALPAYQRAAAKAPTEVGTQRKLIALLDKLRTGEEALAQHEAAARVAPGDADLQLELAKRYRRVAPDKALAVLARLSRRMSGNVGVRHAIAELYNEWDERRLAIVEYEAIVKLEPDDPDHAIELGEAYWAVNERVAARASWQRLATIGTAAMLLELGEVSAAHDLWEDAVAAYTKSLELDGTNPDGWYGRAQANDSLQRFPAAIDDARRAVALIGYATRDQGQRERHLLARILGRWHADTGTLELQTSLRRWRFAFEHGDNAAGYMLAAHHARLGSPQQHDVLVQLYRRVPTDDSLGIALARSYSRRKDFARARKELERIAARTPKRAEEIGELIAQVEEERKRAEAEARWEEEGLSEYERRRMASGGRGPDIVGKRRRIGLRLGVGTDVRDTEGALLGIGMYRASRLGQGTALVVRGEWAKRDELMESINSFALAFGVTTRVINARKLELAAGIGPRFEARYGFNADKSPWNRAGITGDVTLELLPRALPAVVGVRFNQALTDDVKSSTLIVELGFEVR